MGDFEAAEEHLVHALTIKPSYNPTYVYLGLLYARTGKFYQATYYLYRALKTDPSSDEARLGLAYVFYKRDLYEEAILGLHQGY